MSYSYFYLGGHSASWLWRQELLEVEREVKPGFPPAALCISYRSLSTIKQWAEALRYWMLDSKAFTQITTYGRFVVSAKDYARDCLRAMSEIGKLRAVGIQDYMCEPIALRATGLTLREHQIKTVDSFIELKTLAPDVPFMPTLQGFEDSDYFRCIEMYYKRGIDLAKFPRIGLGSVCRRQHTKEIFNLLLNLKPYGLKLHGYGVKVKALERISKINDTELLPFSDSMAWSIHARNRARLPECKHIGQNCNGCFRYALKWRERLLCKTNLISNP